LNRRAVLNRIAAQPAAPSRSDGDSVSTPLLERRRWLAQAAALAAGAALLHGRARAAAFPAKPVKVIVPQAPGGAADQMIRLIAERLEQRWGQSVLIEYKPGGGSVLATQTVARSPADGHTIGTAASSLTLNAVLRRSLPYKMAEVLPLARIGYFTTVLLAHPAVPAKDVRELVALGRKEPLLYGSNGAGSAAHLAGALLSQMAGIEMQHVPYNGAARMYTDMVGGRLPLGFAIATSAESFVKAGQLKVIGVTNAARSPLYPAWPAISETLPGYEAVNWTGLYGPAGMPREIAEQLSNDIVAVLRDDGTRKALQGMGIDVAEQAAGPFAAFIQRDLERITPLAKSIGTLE
jgi:tripartite-type tricarboxylate transporter receptor subunit TctC